MHFFPHTASRTRLPGSAANRSLVIFVLSILILVLQPGCLFHRHKPRPAPVIPPPTRVAVLPANFPPEDPDSRWLTLASVVLQFDSARAASDLELIPLWESMPAVLQVVGNSRTISTDNAVEIATRLSAKWIADGNFLSNKGALTYRLDFMPSQTTLIPFRYEKPTSPGELPDQMSEAYDQFLRYLIVRPLVLERIRPIETKQLREIAEALDAEYGWFVTARPGQAGKVVEDLEHLIPGFARSLFSPTLYPNLGEIK